MNNSVFYIHGQHEGKFNLTGEQLNSLGIVLKAFSQHEKVGCDDKIDSIQFTDEWVILFTTNGVEILHVDSEHVKFTTTNIESSEECTFLNYLEAYEYMFIKESDVISEKIETIVKSLNEFNEILNNLKNK